jgi:hypothetical protein
MFREIALTRAHKEPARRGQSARPTFALHPGRAAARGGVLIGEEDQLQLACPRRNICPTCHKRTSRPFDSSPPGDDLVGHRRPGRVQANRLFATGVSNVPHDPGEHKQRGRPRQQGSDDHRGYRCHDSSLMRPAHSIVNSRPGGSSRIAGLSLLGDRRLRTFVEPFPIGLVALPLTFVDLAAPGRAKLLEVQAEADQPERTVAIRIPATICHEAASALVRRIQRMNCS